MYKHRHTRLKRDVDQAGRAVQYQPRALYPSLVTTNIGTANLNLRFPIDWCSISRNRKTTYGWIAVVCKELHSDSTATNFKTIFALIRLLNERFDQVSLITNNKQQFRLFHEPQFSMGWKVDMALFVLSPEIWFSAR